MRRFILTYIREGHALEIEGVEFSSLLGKPAVLELYPDDEHTSPRVFRNVADMEYHLNEFGTTSIKWLDEEVQSENENTISKSEVALVLSRLEDYYHGRKRAALKAMKESTDAFLAYNHATDAARWKARRDTIYKVAENLEIPTPEHEE